VSDAPEAKDPVEARIEADILALMPGIVARDMPFLGCCYGIGILAHHLGAEVSKRRYGEPVGGVDCRVTEAGPPTRSSRGPAGRFRALVGHKEAVQALPPGCAHLLASDPCPFQMIRHGRNVYATQFHPEADGQGFATRIRIYRDRGYFPPEAAEALTEAVLARTFASRNRSSRLSSQATAAGPRRNPAE
jgi:GMP synthase (glutamine-hydrolysing)